jgi:hypothetical protein
MNFAKSDLLFLQLQIAITSDVCHLNASPTATAVAAVAVESAVKAVDSRCIMHIIISSVVINSLL